MSILRPKTIILSAQSVRPIRASIGGDGSLFVGQQTITDYDSLMEEDDEALECPMSNKRRRLNFLSPEQKLVRRLVKVLLHSMISLGVMWAGLVNSCLWAVMISTRKLVVYRLF